MGLEVGLLDSEGTDHVVVLLRADVSKLALEDSRLHSERLLAYRGGEASSVLGNTRPVEAFTDAHRIRLTYRLVQRGLAMARTSRAFLRARANAVGVRQPYLAVQGSFALHDKAFNEEFMRRHVYRWSSELLNSGGDAVNALRRHFGERVAFYFSFLAHYTHALGTLSACVVLFYYIVRFLDWAAYSRGLSVVGMCVCTIWAPSVVKAWERRQSRLSLLWAVTGKGADEAPNVHMPADDDKRIAKGEAAVRAIEGEFESLRARKAEGGDGQLKRGMMEVATPWLGRWTFDVPETPAARRREARRVAVAREAGKARFWVAWAIVGFVILNCLVICVGTLPFLQWYVFGKLTPTCECCNWFNDLLAAHAGADPFALLKNATAVPEACLVYQSGTTRDGFVVTGQCVYFWSCFTSLGSTVGSDRWLYILIQVCWPGSCSRLLIIPNSQGILLGIILDTIQVRRALGGSGARAGQGSSTTLRAVPVLRLGDARVYRRGALGVGCGL